MEFLNSLCLAHFGTFWHILAHFGTSWYILAHFGENSGQEKVNRSYTKGGVISEAIFLASILPKYERKYFKDFCPGL